jgi:ribosome biogenesis GTPase / thiamine phosphate phosphatase
LIAHPLEPLGFDAARQAELDLLGTQLEPGRVVRVDRGLVTVLTASGEARTPPPQPIAVGDWVALQGDRLAVVLERRTLLRRTAFDGEQLLAANVDLVVVARALDTSLAGSRTQALLAIAWDSGAQPLVLLTKADCADDVDAAVDAVEAATFGVPVLAVSARTGDGIGELRARMAGSTAVLIGESGAGKSTLVNLLTGRDAMATGAVAVDGSGRHTTVHRQLIALPGGGALIDSPGVREAGYGGSREAVAAAFGDVEDLALECRFSDCSHEREPGCAVRAALQSGELVRERFDAWRLALREQAFLARRDDPALRSAYRRQFAALTKARRKDVW